MQSVSEVLLFVLFASLREVKTAEMRQQHILFLFFYSRKCKILILSSTCSWNAPGMRLFHFIFCHSDTLIKAGGDAVLMVFVVEPCCCVHLTTGPILREQKKESEQNNRFNQPYLTSSAVVWELCIGSFLFMGSCYECSLLKIILVKGVGKQIPKKSAVLLLKFPSTGLHCSVNFLISWNILQSSCYSIETNTEHSIHILFLFLSTRRWKKKLFGLVPLHNSERIAITLTNPI